MRPRARPLRCFRGTKALRCTHRRRWCRRSWRPSHRTFRLGSPWLRSCRSPPLWRCQCPRSSKCRRRSLGTCTRSSLRRVEAGCRSCRLGRHWSRSSTSARTRQRRRTSHWNQPSRWIRRCRSLRSRRRRRHSRMRSRPMRHSACKPIPTPALGSTHATSHLNPEASKTRCVAAGHVASCGRSIRLERSTKPGLVAGPGLPRVRQRAHCSPQPVLGGVVPAKGSAIAPHNHVPEHRCGE